MYLYYVALLCHLLFFGFLVFFFFGFTQNILHVCKCHFFKFVNFTIRDIREMSYFFMFIVYTCTYRLSLILFSKNAEKLFANLVSLTFSGSSTLFSLPTNVFRKKYNLPMSVPASCILRL